MSAVSASASASAPASGTTPGADGSPPASRGKGLWSRAREVLRAEQEAGQGGRAGHGCRSISILSVTAAAAAAASATRRAGGAAAGGGGRTAAESADAEAHEARIAAVSRLLARLVDPENGTRFVKSVFDKQGQRRVAQEVGALYHFNPKNSTGEMPQGGWGGALWFTLPIPAGHYRLQCALGGDRELFDKLQQLSNKVKAWRRRVGRGDVSQHGTGDCFRNEQ